MFLVSIPGLNDWVTKAEKEANIDPNPKPQPSLAFKRTLGDSSDTMETEDCLEPDTKKRDTKDTPVEANAKPTPSSVLSAQYILNSPIPDRPGKACMAKVYDGFDQYSLNEIVEVTGFLSVHPCLDGTHSDPSEFENLSEVQSNNPPPSLVPRLHTIHCRTLKHANPLLDPMEAIVKPSEPFEEDIYNDIKLVLTQCLLGDALAAEFLICHLISTVYLRTDMLSIGQFSLNLSNIPVDIIPEYTQLLYSVLEMLIPVSHMLPLTLDNLNTIQFTPKYDYKIIDL